jgi:hypothetical protein
MDTAYRSSDPDTLRRPPAGLTRLTSVSLELCSAASGMQYLQGALMETRLCQSSSDRVSGSSDRVSVHICTSARLLLCYGLGAVTSAVPLHLDQRGSQARCPLTVPPLPLQGCSSCGS